MRVSAPRSSHHVLSLKFISNLFRNCNFSLSLADWCSVDIGDIMVHFLTREARDVHNLEAQVCWFGGSGVLFCSSAFFLFLFLFVIYRLEFSFSGVVSG